jgi:hypothetical protein
VGDEKEGGAVGGQGREHEKAEDKEQSRVRNRAEGSISLFPSVL